MSHIKGIIGLFILVIFGVMVIVGISSAFGYNRNLDFPNGQNYFCPGGQGRVFVSEGTKEDPTLSGRFAFDSRNFSGAFNGPNPTNEGDLFDRLLAKRRPAGGLFRFMTKGFGMILGEEGQILQFYEATQIGVDTLWKEK